MYNAINSKTDMLYYNSEKILREIFYGLNIHMAKPVGVAHHNFNFHGTRVAFKHSKLMNALKKVSHYTIFCE